MNGDGLDFAGDLSPSPSPAKRGQVSISTPHPSEGDKIAGSDIIVGFSKRRPRRRDESHSSGMSTLSTVTTDSSRNMSIQEDDDGYVIRSFDVEELEESDSAATVVAQHFLNSVA